MPRHRDRYPEEFRKRVIELVRAGRSPDELAREYEPTAQTIRNWVAQAERDVGVRTDGLTTEERDELRRLRREVRILREEKEILKNPPRGSAHLWKEKLLWCYPKLDPEGVAVCFLVTIPIP